MVGQAYEGLHITHYQRNKAGSEWHNYAGSCDNLALNMLPNCKFTETFLDKICICKCLSLRKRPGKVVVTLPPQSVSFIKLPLAGKPISNPIYYFSEVHPFADCIPFSLISFSLPRILPSMPTENKVWLKISKKKKIKLRTFYQSKVNFFTVISQLLGNRNMAKKIVLWSASESPISRWSCILQYGDIARCREELCRDHPRWGVLAAPLTLPHLLPHATHHILIP